MEKYARILNELKSLEKELKFLKQCVKTQEEKNSYINIQNKSNQLKKTISAIASN